jgi:hypothetical protein
MGEPAGAGAWRPLTEKSELEQATVYEYPSRSVRVIAKVFVDISSASDTQPPLVATYVRSACAICSKSERTPVRLIACVGAVPSSETGMRFREYS